MLKKLRKALKLQTLFMKRRLIKPSLKKHSNGKTLLHIGCGKKNSPEFINIDARPFPHVHIITDDITDLSDFDSDSVDLIYMCHILEHVKRDDIKNVLLEMKRVLKKGGVLRLSVPDFDRLIDVYNASEKNVDAICRQLMGGQDHQYNIHYSVFNNQSLSEILQSAGFSKVIPWDPDNCQYHDFKDRASRKLAANGREYPISLNLEAIK
jgi:predicted SAM-dependent methyltransferase